jgi:hypothetical protein
MSDTRPWEEYTEIAGRTLSRYNMTDPHEQTVYYVAVMLWTESELADLEKEISDISSINSLRWRKLQQKKKDKYVEISSRVYRFQKTTSNPIHIYTS